MKQDPETVRQKQELDQGSSLTCSREWKIVGKAALVAPASRGVPVHPKQAMPQELCLKSFMENQLRAMAAMVTGTVSGMSSW